MAGDGATAWELGRREASLDEGPPNKSGDVPQERSVDRPEIHHASMKGRPLRSGDHGSPRTTERGTRSLDEGPPLRDGDPTHTATDGLWTPR